MLQSINIIQICEYAPFVNQALELSPDEYDAPYFAAAIYLCVPLWSNDKRLKKQNTVKVFNTQEILQLISKD
jgi:predicted nucleic acid-binding protein